MSGIAELITALIAAKEIVAILGLIAILYHVFSTLIPKLLDNKEKGFESLLLRRDNEVEKMFTLREAETSRMMSESASASADRDNKMIEIMNSLEDSLEKMNSMIISVLSGKASES